MHILIGVIPCKPFIVQIPLDRIRSDINQSIYFIGPKEHPWLRLHQDLHDHNVLMVTKVEPRRDQGPAG